MRIMWMSNAPWSSVGYGVQTKMFTRRLNEMGHPTAISAFYGLEGGQQNWQGMTIYPRRYHPYGADAVGVHAIQHSADIIISLMDAWVNQPEAMSRPWCPWFPIDHEPCPPPVLTQVKKAYAPIVMSRFGERMMENAGLPCYYVPHGVETSIYKPLDQAEVRDRIGWPQDAFVVGMVAANKGVPSRKAFPEHLEAFAEFHKRHPDTYLYLHTRAGNEQGQEPGVNLPELIHHLGLTGSVAFPDQFLNDQGFTSERMADLFNGMDVLMSVSMGEGFGIPILEAQACGTPVIVGDWTAMSELCFSGWKVEKSEAHHTYTALGSWQYTPQIGAIVDRLEQAYREWGTKHAKTRSRLAREAALTYDADTITETHWKPVLADIEQRLEVEKAKKTPTPIEASEVGVPV